MRPQRGTELHGRRVFLVLIGFGVLAVVGNIVRLADGPSGIAAVASAGALIAVGAYGIWHGGYMLEWWGPPEQR